MVETCILLAAPVAGGHDFEGRLRRAAAAHRGVLDGSAGSAAVVRFDEPEDVLACLDELDPRDLRVLMHCMLLAPGATALDSEALRRAAGALARIPPGAPVVSAAFKARLTGPHQARFPKQVLVEGWLPAWASSAAPVESAPMPPVAPVSSRLPRPAEAQRAEGASGVGEVVIRAVREAFDQVDRRLTRSPPQAAILGTFADQGQPLTLDEVADFHHLTRGRTKELLEKAVRKGYLERRDDGTYALLSEEERLRHWVKRRRRKLREHLNSYLTINAGLFAVNLVTSALSPPWFLFSAIGWGVGLLLHWRRTNEEIREALGSHQGLLEPRRPAVPREPALPPPWGELEQSARGLVDQLRGDLGRAGGSPGADPEEMLGGYATTARQLATQGARLDGVLGRFDPVRLRSELAEAATHVEAEPDVRLATTHLDRARLLQDQIRMLERLEKQREASLLKLKNVLTTLENLLLGLSQGALLAGEEQVDSVLESGARDLAQYRDWLAEANAEIERLLR